MNPLIQKKANNPKQAENILFIHGAWQASWVWEDYMSFFSEQGYNCYALTLSGHNSEDSTKKINRYSFKNYMADVADALQQFETAPIIIAHSMGGLIIQKLLQKQKCCSKLVLLTSLPPSGALRATFKLLFRKYYTLWSILSLNLYKLVSNTERASWIFFSKELDKKKREIYSHKFVGESFPAFLALLFPMIRKKYHLETPTLVLGAKEDNIVSPKEIQYTANYYQASYHLFENSGHALMLDTEAPQAAKQILDWLKT